MRKKVLDIKKTRKRLREIREKRGMTIFDLVSAIPTASQIDVHDFEKGIELPTLDYIIDFCNYFHKNLSEVLVYKLENK